jgi:hypothetical protein
MGIQADHLIQLARGGMLSSQRFWQVDAVPLVEVHGLERQGCGEGWAGRQILILA